MILEINETLNLHLIPLVVFFVVMFLSYKYGISREEEIEELIKKETETILKGLRKQEKMIKKIIEYKNAR